MAECQQGKNEHSHILQSTMYVQGCYIISQFVLNTLKQTNKKIRSTSIVIRSLLKKKKIETHPLIQYNNTECNGYSKKVYVYADGGPLSAFFICEKINIIHKEELLLLRSIVDYFP